MFEACRRAYAAPDLGTKRLGWTARVPDQREDEALTKSGDQLDSVEVPWFKVRSSQVYQLPSVVLVEEIVPRDDVPKINPNKPKETTNIINQRQHNTLVKDAKMNKLTSKTSPKDLNAPYKNANTDKKQNIGTGRDATVVSGRLPSQKLSQNAKQRNAVKSGNNQSGQWNRNRAVRGESNPAKDQPLDRATDHTDTTKKKGKDDENKSARACFFKHKLTDDVRKDGGNKSVSSVGGKERQASCAKPQGVLRRIELDAESFFEFLFSDRWQEGCLVRVLTGQLLDNMLHCLTKLEKFHDIISYATIAYFYNRKPLLPCIKSAKDTMEYKLVEERVLVEFDCFYPQERPEVIQEQLRIMGDLCFGEDEADMSGHLTEEQLSISDILKDANLDIDAIESQGKKQTKDLGPICVSSSKMLSSLDLKERESQPALQFKSLSAHDAVISGISGQEDLQGTEFKRVVSSPAVMFGQSDDMSNSARKVSDKSGSLHSSSSNSPDKPGSWTSSSEKSPDKSGNTYAGAGKSPDTSGSLSTGSQVPFVKSVSLNNGTEKPLDNSTSESASTENPRDLAKTDTSSDEGKTSDRSDNENSDAEKPPQDPSNISTTTEKLPDQYSTSGSAEKLPHIPKLIVSAPCSAERTSSSSIPTLPPISDAALPAHTLDSSLPTTAHAEMPGIVTADGMGQQCPPNGTTSGGQTAQSLPVSDSVSRLVCGDSTSDSRLQVPFDKQKGLPGSDELYQGQSSSSTELPTLKCNIRGLTRPRPPHESCLRQFHMIRQPFWKRRMRQQTAFPRVGLPEMPIKFLPEKDPTVDEERELEDEKYLGHILQDNSELVGSTTSLLMYPTQPVSETQCVSRAQRHVSRFSKKLAREKQEAKETRRKENGSSTSLSDCGSSSFVSLSSNMETEEAQRSCPVDPVRKNSFRQEIEMMRKEFLVNPSVAKQSKVNIHKKLKQAMKSKVPPIQLTPIKEDTRTGVRKEQPQVMYSLSSFASSTPTGMSVYTSDLHTVPSLSYENAPIPNPPFNFLKRWNETPTFYEFYLYLLGQQQTEKNGVIKSLTAAGQGPSNDSDWDTISQQGHGDKGKDKKTASSESAMSEPSVEGSREKGKRSDHDQSVQKKTSRLEERSRSDEFAKKSKKKPKGKLDALNELHAHTRIQIAADERGWRTAGAHGKRSIAQTGSISFTPTLPVDTLLKQAALGITVSGSHLLTENQERLLEEEGYILSSIDPWHISVAFAYLAGGVCDSIGVRNDLLKRREKILNLIEKSKEIVRLNEEHVRQALRITHDKSVAKATKIGLALDEHVSHTDEVRLQGKSRLGKEKKLKIKLKGTGGTALEDQDESGKNTLGSKPESGTEASHRKTGGESDNDSDDKIKTETESSAFHEGKQRDKRGRKGRHDGSDTELDRAERKHKHKASEKRRSKKKRGAYVYVDDSDIPNNISPTKLFTLMQLNSEFDPQKLHSAYSFEKIFSHRKDEIPNYVHLLHLFEKPFKQTKKTTGAPPKIKPKAGKKIEETENEEPPVEEILPEVPFVLGKMREFKFLQYRNHKPEPIKMKDTAASKGMSTEEICQNMILAMQTFVVRKERATTTYGSCQYKSKVSVTFTKRRVGEAWVGVPPLVDCQRLVASVCQTLSAAV